MIQNVSDIPRFNGTYAVFHSETMEVYGVFDDLIAAHAEAWKQCPDGGLVSEINLTDEEYVIIEALHAEAVQRENARREIEAWNEWLRRQRGPSHSRVNGRFTHNDR